MCSKGAVAFGEFDAYEDANELYIKAAEAWSMNGDMARCGEMLIKGACELDRGGLNDLASKSFEAAVRVFVPDANNKFISFRSHPPVDRSNPPTDNSPLVNGAFASDHVFKAVQFFISQRDYRSALYCNGAVCALNEDDENATISLWRSYLTQTILQLANNDVVAADKTFVEVHLQSSSYLKSNESKLAEDFITAIRVFDGEALEKCKRERCMGSLDPKVRELAQGLKVSGGAGGGKKKVVQQPPASTLGETGTTATADSTTKKTQEIPELKNIETDIGTDIDIGLDAQEIIDAMGNELDDLDIDDLGEEEEEDDDDDDDDDDSVDLS